MCYSIRIGNTLGLFSNEFSSYMMILSGTLRQRHKRWNVGVPRFCSGAAFVSIHAMRASVKRDIDHFVSLPVPVSVSGSTRISWALPPYQLAVRGGTGHGRWVMGICNPHQCVRVLQKGVDSNEGNKETSITVLLTFRSKNLCPRETTT
ncbi:hypothetical protein J6590_025699 [Homalodisca vitripennis]|nr:hypothetical protein J6590_025699 [Homalodisca vitripennis]